ncbi:lamin tail domain-containing protein [Patescibacteria group bacterium]
MKILLHIICIVIFVGIAVSPGSAYSSNAAHVVISEIKLSGGSGYTKDEFIELYNPSKFNVELSGFRLTKQTSSGNEYDLVTIFDSINIPGFGFLLITHPEGYEGGVEPDVVFDTGNTIANSNSIVLYDDQGDIVDLVGFGSTTIFEGESVANPSAGRSVERKAQAESTTESMSAEGEDYLYGNGYDSDFNSEDFVLRETPDPQNSLSAPETLLQVTPIDPCKPTPIGPISPVPPASPGIPARPNTPVPEDTDEDSVFMENQILEGIILNELFPAPDGSDAELEFIELYNTRDDDIDLIGWSVTDTKSSFVIPKGTTIESENVFVFFRPETKISLNNSGDTVYLINPAGEIVQGVEYGKAESDKAFAFFPEQGWQWTDATPGEENVISDQNENDEEISEDNDGVQVVTVAQAREMEKGKEIQIQGVIIAEPDLLGSKSMYIQDDTGGIKVVATKESFPELSVGDVISFFGKTSTELGQPKINVLDVSTIGVQSTKDVVSYEMLFTDADSYLNQLVTIHGELQGIYRSTITIVNDEGETIDAYLKRTTGIQKPSWEDGDTVSITGVVEYSDNGIRILPRTEDDLVLATVLGESTDEEAVGFTSPTKNKNIQWYLLSALGIAIISSAIFLERFRKQKRLKQGV